MKKFTFTKIIVIISIIGIMISIATPKIIQHIIDKQNVIATEKNDLAVKKILERRLSHE